MKIFAVAVGFAAGLGARFFSKDEGSKDLGYITAFMKRVSGMPRQR
jgi:hypothetical protein